MSDVMAVCLRVCVCLYQYDIMLYIISHTFLRINAIYMRVLTDSNGMSPTASTRPIAGISAWTSSWRTRKLMATASSLVPMRRTRNWGGGVIISGNSIAT